MKTTRCFSLRLAGPVAAAFALALVSCSGAQLSNMWFDPTYDLGPMTDILVIGVKRNAVARRTWEDAFAAEISARGTRATASYQLFPDELPDTMAVVDAVRDRGFDGVLIVHRLETELTTREVPGYTSTEPVTRYSPWLRSYRTFYREVYHPGYLETEREIRHQVDVWTTKEGGRLVWAGTAGLIDPESRDQVRREVVGKIVPELAESGIVAEGR